MILLHIQIQNRDKVVCSFFKNFAFSYIINYDTKRMIFYCNVYKKIIQFLFLTIIYFTIDYIV